MSATDKIRESYVRDQLIEALRAQHEWQVVQLRFLLDAVNRLVTHCQDEETLVYVRDGLQMICEDETGVRH